MAESKGALIAKTMQKHAGRAKEKLLQNLGKVDRTLDDIFEEHLQNFNRQHQQATRLQKEFNNYIRCIRAVQTASKTLMEAITEVYESGWSGHDLLYVQAQNLEMLWQDFSHKLGDQVLIPLNTYTNQFPEFRKKVEKRGRKLVDYDGQRHSFQNLQSNAAKRRDDVKVTKGREQLEEAKRTYEVLNSELHDELPALYDSRVLFYVNNLQTLFSAEQLFHSESYKVFGELEAITDKLATDCQRGSYSKKLTANNISPAAGSPNNTLNNTPSNTLNNNLNGGALAAPDTVQTPPSPALNGGSPPPQEPSPPTPREQKPLPKPPTSENTTTPSNNNNNKVVAEKEETKKEETEKEELKKEEIKKAETKEAKEEETKEVKEGSDKKVEELYDIPVGSPVPPEKSNNSDEKRQQVDSEPREKGTDDKQDEVYDIPVGATLAGLPPGALYRVRATYRYTREDSDELSFDVGEVIRVVEYDDPDEQEEGWLMGIKETTNEKGMFPANFTRPI